MRRWDDGWSEAYRDPPVYGWVHFTILVLLVVGGAFAYFR